MNKMSKYVKIHYQMDFLQFFYSDTRRGQDKGLKYVDEIQ